MKIYHTPGTVLISALSTGMKALNLTPIMVATIMPNSQLRKLSPRRGTCPIPNYMIGNGSIFFRNDNVPGAECGHSHSNAVTRHDVQTRRQDRQDLCDLTKPTQPRNGNPEISTQSYTSPKLIFTPNWTIFLEAHSAEGFRITYSYTVVQENCLLGTLLQKELAK